MQSDRQEWLERRQKGIGSSDAPIIMGKSGFKTRHQLYEDKTAVFVVEDTSNQFIKDRGNDAEPKIRALMELMLFKNLEPKEVQSSNYPWLRASLDGVTEDMKETSEYKLLNKEDWAAAKEKNIVPPQYLHQCLHTLLPTNAEVCHFGAYLYGAYKADPHNLTMGNLAYIPIYRKDYEDEIIKMFMEEEKFWNEHVLKKVPPELCDDDYPPLTGFAKQINRLGAIDEQIKKLTAEAEKLEEEILAAAKAKGFNRYMCAGAKISKIERIGNVNWKAIPELKGVDTDKYRAKPSVFWKISLKKEKKDAG